MKKVAFTTGGTGGHVYPALAIAKEMEKRSYEMIFIGTKYRMEKELVERQGLKFYGLDIVPFKSVKAVLKGIVAIFKSMKILKKHDIDIVIGFGNYISIPTIIAAKLLGKDIYLQEQNIIMGVANKFLARFAKKVFLAFPITLDRIKAKDKSKYVVTGNPLREEFYTITKKDAREILAVEQDWKIVLVMGGSLGAKSINDGVIANLKEINEKPNIRLYWSTGENLYREACSSIKNYDNIIVMPYFENVHEIMAASDLVVSRAGASTISELLELAKPSILIPYDFVGQKENAEMLEYVNGAKTYTNETSKEAIKEALKLCDQDQILDFMRENLKNQNPGNAVLNILDVIEKGTK